LTFPAFLDTCALYGAALNDLLLELAEESAYRPLWSEDVLRELEDALAERVGEKPAQHRVDAMRDAFPDAQVTGYEELTGRMTCDPKGRHVVAAAVRANAEIIVTFNIRDFPVQSLAPYDLVVVHPDSFLLDQLDLYPELTIRAVESIAAGYESPPMTTEEYLEKLSRAGVPNFAERVGSALR
jgi:predicted nucleic acid-binding protein